MKCIIRYDVITKERTVIQMKEEFTDRDKANARWQELKNTLCVFHMQSEKIDVPVRRVVDVVYNPGGQKYTFEVDFSTKPGQAIWDEVSRTFVCTVSSDHDEPEEEIIKRFSLDRLRKLRK